MIERVACQNIAHVYASVALQIFNGACISSETSSVDKSIVIYTPYSPIRIIINTIEISKSRR